MTLTDSKSRLENLVLTSMEAKKSAHEIYSSYLHTLIYFSHIEQKSMVFFKCILYENTYQFLQKQIRADA